MPEQSSKRSQMDQLLREVVECTSCQLCETRLQVCPGRGNPASPIVLVGEGPGKQEDWRGYPFIGRSGAYLADQLDGLGYLIDDLWITNVVRCRSTVMEQFEVRDAPPPLTATVACRTWLERELEIIQPKVILCLGGPAAQAVLGSKTAVNKLRGRWYADHNFQPAVVRVAFHPAYLLRLEGAEAEARTDEFYDDLRLSIEEARRRL